MPFEFAARGTGETNNPEDVLRSVPLLSQEVTNSTIAVQSTAESVLEREVSVSTNRGLLDRTQEIVRARILRRPITLITFCLLLEDFGPHEIMVSEIIPRRLFQNNLNTKSKLRDTITLRRT